MSGETLSANSKNIRHFNMGQKAHVFVTLAIIIIPVVLGAIAYSFYHNATQAKQTSIAAEPVATEQYSDPTAVVAEDGTTTYNDPVTGATAAPTQQAPAANSAAPAASSLPQGVTAAMNSIEANGIKGNSYISSNLDTSSIPPGTVAKFDRASWTQYGPELGAVNASFSALGMSKSGSVTFSVMDGAWKVTGYSLNQ